MKTIWKYFIVRDWKMILFSFFFGMTMFTTGLSGFVGENILATFSSMTLGNSVEQFPKVFGLMMGMMGVAGFFQVKVSDKKLISAFISVELILATIIGYGPTVLYYTFGNMPDYYMLIHYIIVGGAGFCIGFEIPVVMRIIERTGFKLKDNLRIVYAMDYFGAFVGGWLFFDYFLKNFPLTEMGFILSGANFILASAAVIYLITQKMVTYRYFVLLILIIVGFSQYYGYKNAVNWANTMEQKFYEDPIIYKQTTKYQHLVLTKHIKKSDIRLYINGNTQFSSLDEKRYHDLLVHPAMALNPRARNVLILGGGDGLALREVLKYSNVDSVTLVDLDPAMVKFASSNPIMRDLNNDAFSDARVYTQKSGGVTGLGVEGIYLETGKLTVDKKEVTEFVAQVDIFNVDADRFISELHEKKWDVILIDFPDPSSIELAKLYSREFYRKLQWLMADNAVVSIQSTSPYHAKEAYLTIGRTMESGGLKTIPYRQNIPSFGDWGYYLAWNSDISVNDMKSKIKQIDNFQIKTSFITPEVLVASLAFGKNELQSFETCINSLMQPCLLHHYIDAEDNW